MIQGHDSQLAAFLKAWHSGQLHHAWLLAGPKGVGKVHFAREAGRRILAEGAGPPPGGEGLEVSEDHPTARLIAAGSHPDYKFLERVMNKTGSALARNISVEQVRTLSDLFAVTPAMSDWRVVIIDSVDDLEKSGANALLKMLEEPPASTIFFLVSHVPGRLLPTIRSRCRKLVFEPLPDDVMASLLKEKAPSSAESHSGLIETAGGSIGRALELAELDLAPLREQAILMMRDGDPDGVGRTKLAKALGTKAAADRYAAFLQLVPSLIATEARRLDGQGRDRALEAYSRAREASALAPRLSMDAATTAFRMGSILASVAPPSERG